MTIKGWRSRRKAKHTQRTSLPNLTSVQSIASYVTGKLQYTGDPILGGLDDFYQHPEYLEYCIQHSIYPPVDCDDYSVLACALAKQNPDMTPQMVVLVMSSFREILSLIFTALVSFKVPYFPFHEGCFVEVNGKLWFIDTNGLWSALSREEVISRFKEAWGVNFQIVDTKYPFK